MDEWWQAFDSVVRPWLLRDPQSMAVWKQFTDTGELNWLWGASNHGQVARDSPESTAIWEAFLYQRGHIDAFRAVLARYRAKTIQHQRARFILDLGCGGATVAFAFREHFGAEAPLHYIGWDHHGPSLDLAVNMLNNLPHPPTSATVYADLDHAVSAALEGWQDSTFRYVTGSYVFGQAGCNYATAQEIGSGVAAMVRALGSTRVITADAPKIGSCTSHFVSGLMDAGLTARRPSSKDVTGPEQAGPDIYGYVLRFPALEGRTFRQTLNREVEGRYFIVDPT